MRPREDRLFARYRRKGDRQALAELFDRTAPELWRVATHLARDPGLVEDAVQGTFLVAIDDAGSWDARRPVVPWLLGILTNQVRTLLRRRAQRLERERLTRATSDDPVAAAAASELRTRLTEALVHVASPYREVLEQHLVHGHSPAEIATAFGVRDGTVRMRLQRGLAQLRRLLPAGFAAAGIVSVQLPAARLAAVRSIVLAHEAPVVAATVGAAGGLATLFSILAMHKLLASLSVALVVMALAWWSMGSAASPVAPYATDPASTLHTEPTPAPPLAAAPAAADPADATRTPLAARDARPRGTVRVRVVEAGTLRPVPEAYVNWRGRIGLYGTTDAAGEWVAHDTVGRATVELPYVKAKRECEVIAESETLALIELPLRVRADLTVVDSEGCPLVGVQIWGTVREGHLRWEVLGRTDTDGRFGHAWVFPRAEMWAEADGLAPSRVISADEKAPNLRHTIVLREPASTVTGRVVDAAGIGVTTLVAIERTDPSQRHPPHPILVHTDCDGRFACRSVPPGPLRVFALHDRQRQAGIGFLVATSASRVDATLLPSTPLHVELRLSGARVLVEAIGADPTSEVRTRVRAAPADIEGNLANELTRSAGLDASGRAELTGVVPGHTVLEVQSGDRIVTETVDLAADQTLTWRPVLASQGPLRLRLLDHRDQPLVGWRVRASREPRQTETTPLLATTGPDGRAVVAARADAKYEIAASPRDVEHAVLRFPGVRPLGDEQTLRAQGDHAPGTVKGRVSAEAGPLQDGLRVALWSVRDGGMRPEPISAPLRADGSFSLPLIPPGDYVAFVKRGENALGKSEVCTLAPGGGILDIGTITVRAFGSLSVRVRGDHRATLLTLAIRHEGIWGEVKQSNTAPIEVSPFPSGAWDLLVWGEEIAPAQTSANVTAGETTSVEVALTTAVPSTFALAAGLRRTAHRLTIRSTDGVEVVSCAVRFPPDGDLCRGLLPGQYTVEVADRDDHVLATAPLTVTDGRPRVVLGAK